MNGAPHLGLPCRLHNRPGSRLASLDRACVSFLRHAISGRYQQPDTGCHCPPLQHDHLLLKSVFSDKTAEDRKCCHRPSMIRRKCVRLRNDRFSVMVSALPGEAFTENHQKMIFRYLTGKTSPPGNRKRPPEEQAVSVDTQPITSSLPCTRSGPSAAPSGRCPTCRRP